LTAVWIGLFALGFALCAALGEWVADSRIVRGTRLKLDRPIPDDEDAYYAQGRGGIDHRIFYFGLDESVNHARRADVLLLGSSRVQFALRPEFLLPAMDELGLRVYNLAFAFQEPVGWSIELIERHDLRPRIVVANVDGFFNGRESDEAKSVRADNPWNARKKSFEFRAGWELTRRLHSMIPYFNWTSLRPSVFWHIYRSRSFGSWLIVQEPHWNVSIAWPPETERPAKDWIRFARPLKQQIEARGGKLVLMQVPSRQASPDVARDISDDLDVPLIEVLRDDLRSGDRSHLNRDSSEIFTQEFMRQFEKLESVRALLREQSANSESPAKR
jgi:hypothetical protein